MNDEDIKKYVTIKSAVKYIPFKIYHKGKRVDECYIPYEQVKHITNPVQLHAKVIKFIREEYGYPIEGVTISVCSSVNLVGEMT